MERLILTFAVALAAVASATDQNAVAEHPDILRHFHVVPNRSTLNITGGFAGVHEQYRLTGQYDFHHGFQHGGDWISIANFLNAEIEGENISEHPILELEVDVDERLNLEGLKGEQLPVASPFDVFKFTGQTKDGSDLTLFASLIGPWMYVRGRSTPPEESADYFNYHLRMVARSRPFADHNEDGVVNAADYVLMRDRLASNSLLPGAEMSDWHSQFGEQPPDFSEADAFMSAALGSSATAMSVPEPGSIYLLIGAMFCAGISIFRARQ